MTMIYISLAGLFFLGIGASLKYLYRVLVLKETRNVGSLMAILYLTVVYGLYHIPGAIDEIAPFARIGVAILFLDKILTFLYELGIPILKKKNILKPCKKAGTTDGK
jgi:hypothetical protein